MIWRAVLIWKWLQKLQCVSLWLLVMLAMCKQRWYFIPASSGNYVTWKSRCVLSNLCITTREILSCFCFANLVASDYRVTKHIIWACSQNFVSQITSYCSAWTVKRVDTDIMWGKEQRTHLKLLLIVLLILHFSWEWFWGFLFYKRCIGVSSEFDLHFEWKCL